MKEKAALSDRVRYDVCRTPLLRLGGWFLEAMLLWSILDYLFYENYYMLLPGAAFSWFYIRFRKREQIRQRKKRLAAEFRDALNSLGVASDAGYSLENSVAACRRDLERICREDSDLLREFRYMERQMKVSVPAENLFLDLGTRSGVEDIRNFAVVLAASRRSGGDPGRMIRRCAVMLGEKLEVASEIEAVIMAKKTEQNIMSLMPAGMILYLKITSPGFLGSMYGNIPGMAVMTVCLGVYAFSWALGRRIVSIEV